MPGHGHGLPSEPQITRLNNGKAWLEEMRFNMMGQWLVVLSVRGPAGIDVARVPITIQF